MPETIRQNSEESISRHSVCPLLKVSGLSFVERKVYLEQVGEAMPVHCHLLLQHVHIVQAEMDKLVGQHGLVEELGWEAAEEVAEDGF